MSRSLRRKHINKLKKAKNERKALAKLQGSSKMKSKEIDLSKGLVKVTEREDLLKHAAEGTGKISNLVLVN